MGRQENTQPEGARSVIPDDVPAEENMEQNDVPDAEMRPEDHVNRPDQPDFDPAERQPFTGKADETALADTDQPEDG